MKRLILLATALFLTFGLMADAQPRGRMGGGFGLHQTQMLKYPGYQFYQRFSNKLDLSNEQLTKMEKIDDDFQKARIDMQSKIELSEIEFRKAMQNNSSKDDILAKQDKISNLRNQMQKMALSYKIDLYNLLTSDQKEKLDDLRADLRKNMMEQRGSGFGKGMRGPGRGPGNCIGW